MTQPSFEVRLREPALDFLLNSCKLCIFFTLVRVDCGWHVNVRYSSTDDALLPSDNRFEHLAWTDSQRVWQILDL